MTSKIMLVGEAWVEIFLKEGYKTIIDIEDAERVTQHNWNLFIRPDGSKYVLGEIHGFTIFLHQFVFPYRVLLPNVIDHRDRDGLNNRKLNLREATRRVNAINSERSDKAKGPERHGNKWRVRPFINGTRVNLGSYATYEEAFAVWETRLDM